MKRRDFLKYSTTIVLAPLVLNTTGLISIIERQVFPTNIFKNKLIKSTFSIIPITEKIEKTIQGKRDIILTDRVMELKKTSKKKILSLKKDIFIEKKHLNEFVTVREKLKLIQKHVGYGNFNIISFDDMLKVAKYSGKINRFSKEEILFLEEIFYYNPSSHGFFGDRISNRITKQIKKKDVVKIPRTGHYLFKGKPEKTYYKMISDVGSSLILTSGVRSIIKQTKLFLDKIDSVDGNMSLASKSLAPPAFTYHSVADFDVGKKGFGLANFTARFAFTKEFLQMRKLQYIGMRYTINNKDGVRYEPWHIKVI